MILDQPSVELDPDIARLGVHNDQSPDLSVEDFTLVVVAELKDLVPQAEFPFAQAHWFSIRVESRLQCAIQRSDSRLKAAGIRSQTSSKTRSLVTSAESTAI